MSDYIHISEDEVLGILDATEICPKCRGGRGLHIERGEVFGVTAHLDECSSTVLRLVPPLPDFMPDHEVAGDAGGAGLAERARRARIAWTTPGGVA